MPNSVCQVPGCAEALPEKPYYMRYRICYTHCNIDSMLLEGIEVRFCHQCAKFQPLNNFDTDRKTCREKLFKHNARRRQNRMGDKETVEDKKKGIKREVIPPSPPVPLKRKLPPIAPPKPRMDVVAPEAAPLPPPPPPGLKIHKKDKLNNEPDINKHDTIQNSPKLDLKEINNPKKEDANIQRSQRLQNREDDATNVPPIDRTPSIGLDIYDLANFDVPNFDWQAGLLPNLSNPLPPPAAVPLNPLTLPTGPPPVPPPPPVPSTTRNIIHPSPSPPFSNLPNMPNLNNNLVNEVLQGLQERPSTGPQQRQPPRRPHIPKQQQMPIGVLVPGLTPEVTRQSLVAASYQLFQVPPELLPEPVRLELVEYVADDIKARLG